MSSAVSSITNQKYAAEPNQDFKLFARTMADKIMDTYREGAPELQGLSIRRQAVRLATDVLIALEYEYEASLDHDDDENQSAHILTTIEWLHECLLDFGQMYGEQLFVAECLAHYEKVLHGLLGDPSAQREVAQAQRSTGRATK
jgi:hypothetical protein